MAKKQKRRSSRKSLGREGRPHGGNGLGNGVGRLLRQLEAHEKGKNTRGFVTDGGALAIRNPAGKIDPSYAAKLAKAKDKKFKKDTNA